ncbi:MAG: asparagine synthase (glutamine-hydrolyzing) [Deltaproteobacteria bacterium]|nr:asparagine synthase (glutamine-hydrolyzing) [Deltaproteobacteria bacterium]
MCGVAGILRFDGVSPDPGQLARMNAALAHRGPDGEGIQVVGPIGLAHRRLSIIDLSEAGRQPMPSVDRKYWLTYNGEIYNYLELRRELESRGHSFHSHTDSEVILEAYRAHGLSAFKRFNGMWALGLWDTEKQELLLSRDRFGVKPLYLHQNEQRLIFASEMKAILAADPSVAKLDLQSVADFLATPLVGVGTETYFRGLERFQPAELMQIDRRGHRRTRRYWTFTPPTEPLDVRPGEAAERVSELLVDAVKLRFRSDVPVGTCLSGGLDSSSIVAIAARRLGKAPETFSVLYDVPGFDEGEFVDAMVDTLQLSANRVHPDAADLPDVLERCTYFQEEPTAGPGLYSQWHVMRIASHKVKVLLDGQGGDEVFAGYFPYFDPYVLSLFDRARRLDPRAILELAGAGPPIKALTGRDPVRSYLAQLVRARTKPTVDRARRVLRRVPPLWALARAIRSHLPHHAARPETRASRPLLGPALPSVSRPRPGLAPTGDPLTDTLWDALLRSSVPALLHYEDRNSMAFSIEARVPFLDFRLVEYAFQLPMREKIHGARTKVVLRDAMQDILPEKVRQRRDKKGYPTPLTLWLKQTHHREWALDLLVSRRTRQRGFFDPEYARDLFDAHLRGDADHSWALWQLMTLELFCRRYADGPFEVEVPMRQARYPSAGAPPG